MIFQMKQRDDCMTIYIIIFQIKKGRDNMDISYVKKIAHVSCYIIMEYMGFDTGLYKGVAKIRVATLLGDIICLHQCTKTVMNYFHTNSKYGNFVSITVSETHESFSRA